MKRRLVAIAAVIGVISAIITIAILLFQRHQAEVAREAQLTEASAAAQAAVTATQAALAKYAHLKEIDDNVSAAVSRFQSADSDFSVANNAAATAGQSRHDLYNSPPVNYDDALADARVEKAQVERLGQLSQEKSDAARSIAIALGVYYGDAASNALLSEITSASEAEGKYAADWWRAISQITDSLSAQADGRISIPSEDIGALYRASDEEAAESSSEWATVTAKITDLQTRLEGDMASLRPSQDSSSPTAPPLGITSILAPTPDYSP